MMMGRLAAFFDSCFSGSEDCCAESACSPSEIPPAIVDARKSRREIVMSVPFVANALWQKESYITRQEVEVSGVYPDGIGGTGGREVPLPPSAGGFGMTLRFVNTVRVITRQLLMFRTSRFSGSSQQLIGIAVGAE